MPKEQHINTFNKGMVRDTNVIYQPDGTYRWAKNCQIVSQDGNNWAIKDALGNTRIFQINIPYATYTVPAGVPTVTYGTIPTIIGMISFVDKLIIFSTNDETEAGGYGQIGMIKYDTYGEGIQPRANSPTNTYSGYIPLYHHVSLKFTKQRQIEGFAFDETESFQRVYWTDHLNDPRVIDVGNTIYTTYYAETPATPLTIGESYMVLEGVAEHPVGSGFYYGPGLPTPATPNALSGNIFIASATSFDDEFGGNLPTTAKVIKYYPYELLAFQPSRSVALMRFKEFSVGSVYCGTKIYFHRLVDTANGVYTSWSYGSSPVQVGTANSVSSTPSNSYFDYVGAGTTTTLVSSGRNVRIDIYGIDTNFERIQMACAEFDYLLETPRQITIVADEVITGANMILEHDGESNLGDLTLDDITLFPASILKCKTMTTNKGYILIGNITEREELEFNITGITLSEINSRFAVHSSDTTSANCSNVLTYDNITPSTAVNPTIIYYGHQYQVFFGDMGANQVVYNGNNYVTGDVFTGISTVGTITIAGAAQVRPIVYRNKYDTTGGTPRPDIIGFYPGEEFWTYKNPAMVHHKLGYWADEKYRFGIMFYDLKGNPYYVRWIGDFTFSSTNTTPVSTIASGGGTYSMIFLQQRGLSIDGITIPAEDIDKISGFSIVRAERDKKIITSGMLVQLGAFGAGTGSLVKPLAGPGISDTDYATPVVGGAYTYYGYICPDALVGFPMPEFRTGNKLYGGYFVDPPTYAGAANRDLKSVDANNQMECRYLFQTSPSDGNYANRSAVIRSMTTINENDVANNFGAGNMMCINALSINGAAGTTVDQSCTGGGTPSFKQYAAAGGRKTFLEVENVIYSYQAGPPSIAYGNLATESRKKIVIDVWNDNTNQYGGTSENALANTLYISTGHFQPINASVKADTLDINGDYTFNNVEIWGGDCYTYIADYGYGLYDAQYAGSPVYTNGSYSLGFKFPCQGNANYELRRGRTIANNKMAFAGNPNGVWYNWLGSASLESFDYNEAYSSQGVQFAYPALPANYVSDNNFKYRVRYGGLKLPGESINSFRQFFPADFKDLDGQGGEINNIRTKDGRVIVWQNAITSTIPVLERQLLAGGDGAPTSLGTGGVVDRFDPLTSYFGNQHQHGLTQTEYGFIWFDMRRKAVVVMDINAGIVEVSQTEGMKSYFDEILVDNLGQYVQSKIINSPEFLETSDRPLVGVGVTGVYDPKFKMSYLTFKYRNHIGGDPLINLDKDFTIGYYHPSKIFVAFYDWTPAIAHNHNQIVLSVNNPKNKTVYYGDGMVQTTYAIGDVVKYLNAEWICIQAVTVGGYRIDATKEPGTAGAAYWTKINQENEIWVHNQPTTLSQVTAPDYLYNKFFGQVIDNEIEIIVNPKTANPFAVTNMEQVANNAFPTAVYIDAGSQSASDTDIRTTSNYYRYIWDRICSNMPLSTTGRIVNNYLKIKIVKRNWTGSAPTTVSGVTRILQMITSFFVQKR